MSPFYNFTPVIPDNVKDIEYPTLKELVEEFVQHYGNKSEEEFDEDSDDELNKLLSDEEKIFKSKGRQSYLGKFS